MATLDFDQILFRINKLYTENTNDNLKEFNVTRSEMSFLLNLNEETEITQRQLAESRNLNNATVTRALERLEKKGFVKRIDDKKDKRKKKVLLTDEGKEVLTKILEKHEKFKQDLFSEFDENEYGKLLKLLNKLFSNLEKFKKEK